LAGQDDVAIWNAAQHAERFLITQDLDFSDIRRYLPGTHYGLMIVRLRDPSRTSLAQRVSAAFETEHIDQWKRSFVVVTDRKIRVRYPSTSE
jgi:predicted nuclease of predicted toxin-antitoxin system